MEVLDFKKWKRNKKVIQSKLTKKASGIVAKEKLFIYFPAKFVDKGLTILGNTIKAIGIIAIRDEKDNYAVLQTPGVLEITPNEFRDVEMDKEHYYEIIIEKNEFLIDNTTVVKNQDLVYVLFELFLLQGKIPWYIEYLDLLKIFSNLPKYTGSSVGSNTLPFELFIAMAARDVKDPEKEFRSIITKESDIKTKPFIWVGLQNIYYSFRSTLAKVGGSYFKQGLIVANVKPESKPTDLENLLRK